MEQVLPLYQTSPMVYDLFSGTGTVAAVASIKQLTCHIYEKHPIFIPIIAKRVDLPRPCDAVLHVSEELQEVLTPLERVKISIVDSSNDGIVEDKHQHEYTAG
eukprot:Nk52_evm1s2123 gene=Nk52_evmTU1s2123